ncbi:predicted protein, partial [Postia placenta Mad-698-R]
MSATRDQMATQQPQSLPSFSQTFNAPSLSRLASNDNALPPIHRLTSPHGRSRGSPSARMSPQRTEDTRQNQRKRLHADTSPVEDRDGGADSEYVVAVPTTVIAVPTAVVADNSTRQNQRRRLHADTSPVEDRDGGAESEYVVAVPTTVIAVPTAVLAVPTAVVADNSTRQNQRRRLHADTSPVEDRDGGAESEYVVAAPAAVVADKSAVGSSHRSPRAVRIKANDTRQNQRKRLHADTSAAEDRDGRAESEYVVAVPTTVIAVPTAVLAVPTAVVADNSTRQNQRKRLHADTSAAEGRDGRADSEYVVAAPAAVVADKGAVGSSHRSPRTVRIKEEADNDPLPTSTSELALACTSQEASDQA